jgi:hypothetical protein
MFFFDIFPFLLIFAGPIAIAQYVLCKFNALQFDFDLSLAGLAYS